MFTWSVTETDPVESHLPITMRTNFSFEDDMGPVNASPSERSEIYILLLTFFSNR